MVSSNQDAALISYVIQLSVAPAFLLSGVAALLSVITNRIARVIDRARLIEERWGEIEASMRTTALTELTILVQRARLARWAINEIISKHYSLNAARLRLFRTSIGEPLQRLGVVAAEHLEILDACLKRDADLATQRLAQHIEISREHTLGIRPMRGW